MLRPHVRIDSLIEARLCTPASRLVAFELHQRRIAVQVRSTIGSLDVKESAMPKTENETVLTGLEHPTTVFRRDLRTRIWRATTHIYWSDDVFEVALLRRISEDSGEQWP